MKKVILTVFLCFTTIGITQAKRMHIPMRVRTILYEQKKKGGIRHAPAIKANLPIVELDDNNHCNWGWKNKNENGYFLSDVLNAEESPVFNDNAETTRASHNYRYKLKTATFTK